MDDKIVEVEDLTKIYPPDIRAVDGVSLCLHRGKVFSLLGPNGAGKTTTVEIIEGLRNPTSGRVTVFGVDVASDYGGIRDRVGILPQNFEPFDLLKPTEAITYWSQLFRKRLTKRETARLIDIVGLSERRGIMSKKLSGGEKRKLGIALSLVNDPELLFLDEPTTGLDPKARRDIWRLIGEIGQRGTTVFLTTHYLDEAEKLSDDVAIMHRGKIIVEGAPDDLIARYGKKTVIVLAGAGETGLAEVRRRGLPASEVDGDVLVPCGDRLEMRHYLAKLSAIDVPMKDMYTRRETLEDVFLSLVGQKMENGVLQQ